MENNTKPQPLIMETKTQEEAERIAEEQMKRMRGEVTKTAPLIVFEEDPGKTNTFLLLFTETSEDDGEDKQSWEEVVGREEAFEHIINNIEVVDLTKSYIAIKQFIDNEDGSTSVEYVNRKSLYGFLKYVIDNELVDNPSNIDPDDYVYDTTDESEYNEIGDAE